MPAPGRQAPPDSPPGASVLTMDDSLFGSILLSFNLVTQEQLNEGLRVQQDSREPQLLGEILMARGVIDSKTVRSILSVQTRKIKFEQTQRAIAADDLKRRLEDGSARQYLKITREIGASDLYLTSKLKPMVRLHGNLIDLPLETLSLDLCRELLYSLMTDDQIARYQAKKFVDLRVEFPEVGRFRGSIFKHNRGIGGVFRVLPEEVEPFSRLGLPRVIKTCIHYRHGLVLLTGSVGSGKSTTLASMIDMINKNSKRHVLMIEDPIEMVTKSDQCFITQREIHTHTDSFANALRAGLRQDPDVLVVGELRDPETVSTTLTAAETGHLVFGTLHTRTAPSTILRLLDQFPSQKRAQVRTMLAGTLRAVVSQQLIPNIDGQGRSVATEVMIVNLAIANLIRQDQVWQIPTVMQMSKNKGMHLMDDSLKRLIDRRKISLEEGLSRATVKDNLLALA